MQKDLIIAKNNSINHDKTNEKNLLQYINVTAILFVMRNYFNELR